MGNFFPARLNKGAILTYNQEGTRTFEGETLEVVPVWKWLLGALAEKQDEGKRQYS